MFTSEMIAPCGLDCSLCLFAHSKEKPCPGCRGEGENKPEFCSKWCAVIPCEKRLGGGYEFCDECPDYPCADLKKLEDRYMRAYPLKESPMENLRDIRELGMEAFLKREREKWSCKNCGGPICVHNGVCRDCGNKISG